MTTTQLIVPMTFMLNTRDNKHQEWYGEDAFYDLGFEDENDWKRFKPRSVCCVINYVEDDVPITAPDKLIQFSIWLHDFTEVRKRSSDGEELFAFCGRHVCDHQITRTDAQADAALKDLFNKDGDFKQFKIRLSDA